MTTFEELQNLILKKYNLKAENGKLEKYEGQAIVIEISPSNILGKIVDSSFDYHQIHLNYNKYYEKNEIKGIAFIFGIKKKTKEELNSPRTISMYSYLFPISIQNEIIPEKLEQKLERILSK